MACDAALVGARGTSSGSSVTTTAGTTSASGSSFALLVSWDGTVSISGTITDSKGNTYTAVGTPQGDWTRTWGVSQWFYCQGGTGGTSHSVTVNFTGTAFPTAHLIEVTSANGAPVYDSAAFAQTQDAASPWTVTSGTLTNATSVLLSGCGANRGADGAYSSSNFTVLSQEPAVSSFWTSGAAKLVVSATTAVVPSWTVLNRIETAGVTVISFYEPAGASGPVGLASESDTALALSPGSSGSPVGLANETDTAQPLFGVNFAQLEDLFTFGDDEGYESAAGGIKLFGGFVDAGATAPAGLSAETDTALPRGSARPAGLSAETDAALALAARQVRAVGLAAATDTALALVAVQIRAVGIAAETDTALALGGVALQAVGLASEADTALALAAVQVRSTGRADETDSALALSSPAGSAAGLAVETDSAFALSAVQIRSVGLATETDAALALSANVGSAAGRADETDSALGLAGVQLRAVGLATETDSALVLAGVQLRAAGLATETDTALALARLQLGTVGIANETDNAQALLAAGAQPPGIASETDAAFALDGVQVGIVIPQTSFAEFSGAVVKSKAEPRQPRVRAPKARVAREKAVELKPPVIASVGMSIETCEAMALAGYIVDGGLMRSMPKPQRGPIEDRVRFLEREVSTLRRALNGSRGTQKEQ
jgi:hypothetical protein